VLAAVSEGWRAAFLVGAGLGAGLVNGLAGGGTLVSFPVLLAIGVPALQANVTSTVGICSGYLGGAGGFRREIGDQRTRLTELAPVAVAGAVAGAVLLIVTPGGGFSRAAPYLILVSCALFCAQPVLARRLARSRRRGRRRWVVAQGGTLVASVYGSYFGAGLGVLLLAILGTALPDTLVRTNGLRSVLALGVNAIAAVAFMVGAHVRWGDAGFLAISSLVGGYLGARLARRIPAAPFRVVVVLVGLAAAARLLVG
jgi:uncharacterized protein